jgi:two-component system, NarL family, nitrate/nitrite response regulator NarL
MKVLIADDHAMMRSALAGAVAMAAPDASITMAGDFPSAWAAGPGHDLILCDLLMPGAGPQQGISQLRAAAGEVPLLVVTGSQDDQTMLAILALGVAGFVPKAVSGPVLEAAIRLVMAGGQYLPPRLAALALRQPAPAVVELPLTPRQRDVLRAIADGRTTKEIALELGIAPATVKAHTATILDVLGASNRAQAAAIARAAGIL